jgi:hypothetical protein
MHIEYNAERETHSVAQEVIYCMSATKRSGYWKGKSKYGECNPPPPPIPFQNYTILKGIFFTDITFCFNYVLL